MSSILTYTEKQYKKTLKQEAFEDGYAVGSESRQPEIDELNEVISKTKAENDKLNTQNDALNETIAEDKAEIDRLKLLLISNGIDPKDDLD